MLFRDGAHYEGTWYLGRAHGYGKFTHVKGETYEGEWADDMRHGTGELTPLTGVRYHGSWFKNRLSMATIQTGKKTGMAYTSGLMVPLMKALGWTTK